MNAGRPMRPIAACAMSVVERTRVSQVTPANTRHSPRNGLRLMSYSSRRSGFFVTVTPGKLASQELDASVETSGPRDFAVRIGAVRQERQRGHRIPPRVRDDREPPLVWDGTAVDIKVICGWGKKNFWNSEKLFYGRHGRCFRRHSGARVKRANPESGGCGARFRVRAGARPEMTKNGYAARIFAMKRSSSSRSRALSLDRLLAEFNTSSEAEPVSVAPRLTCMMLAAASSVPRATL